MPENKTEQVKQLIVRYIRDKNMKRGSKLPSQDFFRRRFKCGTATVSAAISDLKNDKVLEVRDKVGVFIIDPNADGHSGRTVGITTRHISEVPYYSTLLCCLQKNLILAGCKVHIFCYAGKVQDSSIFSVNDFPGLKRSIENNIIDGLIHLDSFFDSSLAIFRKHNIPLLFVGSIEGAKNGLFYDIENALKEIYRKLQIMNVKRTSLFATTVIRKYVEPLLLEITKDHGAMYSACTLEESAKVARDIIAQPRDKRPEYIIYTDDVLAQKIIAEFAINLPNDELPGAIIMRSKQLMQCFAVKDPIFFDIDLEAVAKQATNILLDAIKKENPDIGHVLYTLAEGQ